MRAALAVLLLAAPAAAKVYPSKTLPGVLIDDRDRPGEGARLEEALKLLQGSAAVKPMEERRRKLGPVVVEFSPVDPSSAAWLGYFDDAQDPPRVRVSEAAVSSGTFIEVLAHELYGHGVILRESERLGLDVGHLMHNETFSLAIGAVAALEVGEPARENSELDWLAVSTKAHAAQTLFADSEARRVLLTLEEARDPRGAIAARLEELERRRKHVDRRPAELHYWRWRIEHFEKVHGADPRTLDDVRGSVDATLDEILPARRKLLDGAREHLKDVPAYLDEPEGKAFTAKMIETARSPYARELDERLWALGRRFAELSAARGPAAIFAPDPVKRLDWDGLRELERADRAERPEHWKDAPDVPADEAPPWTTAE